LLGPVVELGDDREREDLDLDIAVGAVAPPLGVMVAADRDRAGNARDPRLFERLARRGLMRIEAADQIALRNDPATRIARRDEKGAKGAVLFGAIGQGGDLVDDSLRLSAPLATKGGDGEPLSQCTI
jgi:hypothetical protein